MTGRDAIAELSGLSDQPAFAQPVAAPRWRWWWMGAPIFVGIELVVHSMLAVRSRPNFYRGDG